MTLIRAWSVKTTFIFVDKRNIVGVRLNKKKSRQSGPVKGKKAAKQCSIHQFKVR
jgi:hypothetical protein